MTSKEKIEYLQRQVSEALVLQPQGFLKISCANLVDYDEDKHISPELAPVLFSREEQIKLFSLFEEMKFITFLSFEDGNAIFAMYEREKFFNYMKDDLDKKRYFHKSSKNKTTPHNLIGYTAITKDNEYFFEVEGCDGLIEFGRSESAYKILSCFKNNMKIVSRKTLLDKFDTEDGLTSAMNRVNIVLKRNSFEIEPSKKGTKTGYIIRKQ